jgi:hypothetical protein
VNSTGVDQLEGVNTADDGDTRTTLLVKTSEHSRSVTVVVTGHAIVNMYVVETPASRTATVDGDTTPHSGAAGAGADASTVACEHCDHCCNSL